MKSQSNKKAHHPLAGKSMTGAEMVIETLAQEGVDTVFGYTGGYILPVYDALYRYNAEREPRAKEQIRLIVPANEQGAGFMAAGYARASGKVGVFIVTSGPGATNSVTPIRDCMADSIPVVLISGQVVRASIGTDAFQEAPVYNLMSACAKHVFLVEDPEDLEASIRTAFEIARSGRPGPVKEPRRLITSGSMGTMGFGLPASTGAQAAFPGKTVLDIDGDGSLRMNIGELETATTYNPRYRS